MLAVRVGTQSASRAARPGRASHRSVRFDRGRTALLLGSRVAVALIALGVATPPAALASGTIFGGIRTSTNQPVPYTRVTWGAVAGCGPVSGHAYTTSTGTWTSPVLPNGTYSQIRTREKRPIMEVG